MERKKFLLFATAGTIAVAVPTWYYNFERTAYDQSLINPQLLSNIWDTETIIVVGQGYQKQHPHENSEQKLVELLSADPAIENGVNKTSLAHRTEEDFRTGKIVTVDGWILSVTEGRQCALFSLVQSK